MRTVILAGGLGTRLAEETDLRPKPMVEIGGMPILWHIMSLYAAQDFREFVIALGYKGDMIKRFFTEYSGLTGSLSLELGSGRVRRLDGACEDWNVHLIETGLTTNTGGRIKRMAPWLRDGTFLLTYGDGLSNVNLTELVRTHRRLGKLATVTAVRPPARFGGLVFDDGLVREFTEKAQSGEGWINGGFFVFEPELLDYLDGDHTSLEADCLRRLATEGQLAAYRHEGFWQPMDTLRDKRLLESLWQEGQAPWRLKP
jgi:glucose-1-phosphate cytidylyltransferase